MGNALNVVKLLGVLGAPDAKIGYAPDGGKLAGKSCVMMPVHQLETLSATLQAIRPPNPQADPDGGALHPRAG